MIAKVVRLACTPMSGGYILLTVIIVQSVPLHGGLRGIVRHACTATTKILRHLSTARTNVPDAVRIVQGVRAGADAQGVMQDTIFMIAE